MAPPKTIEAFPACFKSQVDYDDWKKLARLAREDASPCTDCTLIYKTRMLYQGRCNAKQVRSEFAYNPKKTMAIQEAVPA